MGIMHDPRMSAEEHHSFNVVGLYEKGPLGARVAYNWRNRYLITASDCCVGLPVWNEAAGYLDASIRYKVTENFELNLEGSNLLNTQTYYWDDPAQHGDAQVKIWRRSYDIPPPALEAGDPRSERGDRRYAGLPAGAVPLTECLKDTVDRVLRSQAFRTPRGYRDANDPAGPPLFDPAAFSCAGFDFANATNSRRLPAGSPSSWPK